MKKSFPAPPTYHFTPEGLQKLKQEYLDLQNSRPEALEHLKKSRELGDLSENGYYKASKQKIVSIDNRLRRVADLIKYAKIIESSRSDTVLLGSNVTLSNGETQTIYRLVGSFESNPSENTISNVSPLGKSLLGKRVGEVITIRTPRHTTSYKVLEIN